MSKAKHPELNLMCHSLREIDVRNTHTADVNNNIM